MKNSINNKKPCTMEYMLIVKEGFREEVAGHMEQLEKLSNEDLIKRYNRQVEIGIVAVYAQAVFLASMRYVFLARFQKSPVSIYERIIVKLNDKVLLKDGILYYLNGEEVLQ